VFSLDNEENIRPKGELIWYERENTTGPKQSAYTITQVPDADGMVRVLEKGLGIVGVVKKRRTLVLVGQTRVHIDQVEGLGDYLELEVVLRDDQPLSLGQEIAQNLMSSLGVQEKDLVDVAYIDLLIGGSQHVKKN